MYKADPAMLRGRVAAPRRYPPVASVRLVAMLLLCVLGACSRSDPEIALRETVAALVASVEARDPAALQQHLAEDFIGNDVLDRAGARRLAAGYALRHRDIGVSLGPLTVEMASGSATVRCNAFLRGGDGGAVPESARVYEIESGWRLEHGEWKLVSARWTPAL